MPLSGNIKLAIFETSPLLPSLITAPWIHYPPWQKQYSKADQGGLLWQVTRWVAEWPLKCSDRLQNACQAWPCWILPSHHAGLGWKAKKKQYSDIVCWRRLARKACARWEPNGCSEWCIRTGFRTPNSSTPF